MNIFKHTKILKSNTRDLLEEWYIGHPRIRVIFNKVIHHSYSLFGHVIYEFDETQIKKSCIMFVDNLKYLAKMYAENAEKCDEVLPTSWMYYAKVYLPGSDVLKEYGFFYVRDAMFTPDTNVWFCFNEKYINKFGERVLASTMEQALNGSNIHIQCVKKRIDEIIGSRGYVDRHIVPMNTLNATSNELGQLKQLIDEYKESQDKYVKFLAKLSAK